MFGNQKLTDNKDASHVQCVINGQSMVRVIICKKIHDIRLTKVHITCSRHISKYVIIKTETINKLINRGTYFQMKMGKKAVNDQLECETIS